MNDDLISRSELIKASFKIELTSDEVNHCVIGREKVLDLIQNAPAVERPRGKLIIKNHMETCEKCGSVMPMMNDYYRAKLRGCPYCLTEFTNLTDMRKEEEG